MTKERVIREIRIDEAAGRGDSDSRVTCFEVINNMPLKLQSTKICVALYNIYMHNTNCHIVRSVALYRLVIRENE